MPGPPWQRAPEHELGVSLPLDCMIVCRDDVRVTLRGAVAYSTGFKVWLQILRRADDLRAIFQTSFDVLRDGEVTDKFLRFGVEFSDGRRATNLDGFTTEARLEVEEKPPVIYLDARGQASTRRMGGLSAWIWPLPPPGQIAIVTEWPRIGLTVTKTEIAAEPIIEAGARSEKIWDDEPAWEDEVE